MRGRAAQNALLLLLGGTVLVIVRTGEHLKYVRPSLTPLLVASGVLICVLALAAMVRDYRAGEGDTCADDHDHEHGHGSGPVWALAAPILVLLAVAPPAIGVGALDSNSARSGNAPAAALADWSPPQVEGVPELALPRVVQLAQPDSGADVAGLVVAVTGFVAPSTDGAGVDLARIAIMCCAADARTLRMHLRGDFTAPPQGTWVQVEGTIGPGSATEASAWVPDFHVTALAPVPTPEFEYATF